MQILGSALSRASLMGSLNTAILTAVFRHCSPCQLKRAALIGPDNYSALRPDFERLLYGSGVGGNRKTGNDTVKPETTGLPRHQGTRGQGLASRPFSSRQAWEILQVSVQGWGFEKSAPGRMW